MNKIFKFDVILEEEDMCDREEEKQRLLNSIEQNRRLVLYSPRRMGKTSLVHVCRQKFQSQNPKSFFLEVDLNEVASLKELATRFRSHYELALWEQFPIKRAKAILNRLISRVKLSLPGEVDFSLEAFSQEQPEEYLLFLFHELGQLSKQRKVGVILDEFQGIASLIEAQSLLRRELKKLSRAAVILLGSNQRLLYQMFNDKNFPFFGFGEDLELAPIPISAYLPYMNERLAKNDLVISKNVAIFLMEKMNGLPNYINELGAWITDHYCNLELTQYHIEEAIAEAARSKRGRYQSALYGYTLLQKKFLIAVAQLGRVHAPTGGAMINATGLSPTELHRTQKSLIDAPLLSLDSDNHLFIMDPFLKEFLKLR